MKIAVVCPIGNLNRFGYWRNARLCLESWLAVGDLFLIESSRAVAPLAVPSRVIQEESTLMTLDNGAEIFDYRIIAANANRGMGEARALGYDVAVTICVNWYVEQEAARRIVEKCQRLPACGMIYDFLHRRLQMADRLFDSDLRSIAMFDLHQARGSVVKVLADQAELNGISIFRQRDDYTIFNAESYIDTEFELTTDELQDKLIDVRNYEDILSKRHGVTWRYWLDYYQRRAAELTDSREALGDVGRRIVANHPAGAFSDWLLEQMTEAA